MHSILLLALLATTARPGVQPLRAATERAGIRLGTGNVLKVQLTHGVLVDSNPNNTPALEYLRLARRQTVLNMTSPAVGTSISPAVAWKFDRRHMTLELNASARAWMVGFVGEGIPPRIGTFSPFDGHGTYFPLMRAGLDLNVDGALVLNVARNQQLITQLRLLRTTAPSPELLGTLLGRTTLSAGEGWAVDNRRKTWAFTLQSAARADVMDNLYADLATWRALANSRASPVYLGGLGVSVGAMLEHTTRTWGGLYLRGQVGASATLDAVALLSVSAPVSLVGGWHLEHRSGFGIRVEAGAWLANTVCPQSLYESCPAHIKPTAPNRVPDALRMAPIPVGLIQWDQVLHSRLLFSLKASKDARTTLLYAFVDEKRLDASLTSQLFSTLQLRAGTAFSWLSYGAPLTASFARTEIQAPAESPLARLVDIAGRQDALASGDLSLRWAAAPWLVLSVQEALVLLLTSVQVQRSDGVWENPGLFRSVTAATVQLQW